MRTRRRRTRTPLGVRVVKSTHSPPYLKLRELLVQERIKASLSQRQLATRLEKPRSFVSKVETGERRLDVVEFIAYTQAIGCDPYELLRQL